MKHLILFVFAFLLVGFTFSVTTVAAQEGIEVSEGPPGLSEEWRVLSEGEEYYVTAYLRSKDYWTHWCDVDVDECILAPDMDPRLLLTSYPGIRGAFLFSYVTQYTGTYVGYSVANYAGELCHTVPSLATRYCFRGIWNDYLTHLLDVERTEGEYTIDVLVISEVITEGQPPIDPPPDEPPVTINLFLPVVIAN